MVGLGLDGRWLHSASWLMPDRSPIRGRTLLVRRGSAGVRDRELVAFAQLIGVVLGPGTFHSPRASLPSEAEHGVPEQAIPEHKRVVPPGKGAPPTSLFRQAFAWMPPKRPSRHRASHLPGFIKSGIDRRLDETGLTPPGPAQSTSISSSGSSSATQA